MLNECIQHDISFVNVERKNVSHVQAIMNIPDVKKLRKIARNYPIKVSFGERKGMYLYKQKGFRRFGFVAGILVFFLVVGLLSQMVWRVDVEGASPQIEHEIRVWAQDQGLAPGSPQWRIPAESELQQRVSEEVPGATWIGVEKRGTSYQFQVVEQQLAEEREALSPRNLVAMKNGVIHELYVENGRAAVELNDVVQVGDLLISGLIGREGEESAIAAEGTIRAETWYQGQVQVPMTLRGETYTGERASQYELRLGDFAWQFWGRGVEEDFDNFHEQTESIKLPLVFTTIELPIERTTYSERGQREISYSVDEASERAKQVADRELRRQLGPDAEVISENILQTRTDNGKVTVSIHYEVIENIAEEAPISQGE
ncbi:sporulation protein YqfD [Geomicrobium sp. JCM 19037]|uniref:sporulation protein YqfD n=1 Tax=Geomicrobium sp. JCM 19037 TaxID=1460634 RepID=UPI002100FAE2|nr:sporulation protein YqfD [Geomicrobium sp. JCM 19037]